MDFQLYNYFRSSPSYRVRIALHIKGLEFEYKPVHLLKDGGQQHSEEYRKLNPAREVPALVHESQVITQSMAIIEYLDECFPNPSLFPKEPGAKARVRQLCENINCTHSLQNLKVLQYLEKELGASEAQKQKWLNKWMERTFEVLEEVTTHTAGKFCWGDEVSAADLFLVPQVFSAKRFNIEIDRFKILHRINENCLKLEAFKKAHPHRQIDTPAELKE
jgi:maleylacetoacetate isomerase/maleylpyruvate isomerase